MTLRILLSSGALLAVAGLCTPSLAAETVAAAPAAQQVTPDTPRGALSTTGRQVAAELPVAAPVKATAKETAPAPAAAAVRAKPARVVAVKPRAVPPVAVSRPRAAPYRAYRIARYPVPHPYNGGRHMLMLGVAY
jgi:hypothetical protein